MAKRDKKLSKYLKRNGFGRKWWDRKDRFKDESDYQSQRDKFIQTTKWAKH